MAGHCAPCGWIEGSAWRILNRLQPGSNFQHIVAKFFYLLFSLHGPLQFVLLFGLYKQHRGAFFFSFKQTMTLELRRKLVTGESLFLMMLRSNSYLTYRTNSPRVSFNVSELFIN